MYLLKGPAIMLIFKAMLFHQNDNAKESIRQEETVTRLYFSIDHESDYLSAQLAVLLSTQENRTGSITRSKIIHE